MSSRDRPRRLPLLLIAALAFACRPPGPAPGPAWPANASEHEPGAPPSVRDDLTGVPPEALAALPTCELALALSDEAGAEGGMRSVRLGVVEGGDRPRAAGVAWVRWPDGSLRAADAALRPRFMGKALAALARAGFFEGARAAGPVEAGAGPALEIEVSIGDGGGGRRRWALRSAVDEAALELLWDLAVVVHENPDVEAYAHVSALYNRAAESYEHWRRGAVPAPR